MVFLRASYVRLILILFSTSFLVAQVTPRAFSQDVRSYHYNNSRTGLNSSETVLTPGNVNFNNFGKLLTITVDGLVDAQPLYLSNVMIQGAAHDLLILATEHASVYAFDTNTAMLVWRVSTLKPHETTSDDRNCSQITPEIGITSTPVISRPAGSNGIIYVVAMSKDSSGNYHQRLHALDAATGNELLNGPVDISGKYPGTGDNSSGGYVIFDPGQYVERSALLMVSNEIFLAWASHCDVRPYTGWIMGYNANTLAQNTVINVTPNGNEGAIWGSGAGLTADNSGNIFFLDANGIFDTTLNSKGFPSSGDYGNAFIRLNTTGSGGLAIADYFEMDNGQNESANDIDLGSGGALLLPPMTDSSGNTRYLAAGAGKDTNIYLVDRTNMGKFNSSTNKIYQELTGALPGGVWSMPAYFNNKLYYGPVGGPLVAFQFQNAKLNPTPVAQTGNIFDYPGATPSISSNNNTNGIVWAAENNTIAELHAYNANTLQEIYNSNQAGGRDHFGLGNKFITPLIINGRVYVGTTTGVGVFGLFPDRK